MPLVCVALLSLAGPYDAPPGGCQIPPDYVFPAYQKPSPLPSPPLPPKAQPPPAVESSEELDEELERALYERESAEYLSDTEDWDAIEEEYNRDMYWREVLRQAAALLTLAFVVWLVKENIVLRLKMRAAANAEAASKKAAAAAAPAPDAAAPKEAAAEAITEAAAAGAEKPAEASTVDPAAEAPPPDGSPQRR